MMKYVFLRIEYIAYFSGLVYDYYRYIRVWSGFLISIFSVVIFFMCKTHLQKPILKRRNSSKRFNPIQFKSGYGKNGERKTSAERFRSGHTLRNILIRNTFNFFSIFMTKAFRHK